jgi:uncharacterized protein with GYD domain
MPKYLIQASYTTEGLKGLVKDKASGRKAAIEKALGSVGAKMECFYYSFGNHDVVLVVDGPDNISAAALAFSVCATGLAHTKTTPLLTVEETDKALQKSVSYKGPGK